MWEDGVKAHAYVVCGHEKGAPRSYFVAERGCSVEAYVASHGLLCLTLSVGLLPAVGVSEHLAFNMQIWTT